MRHALTEAGLHIEGGPQLWEFTTQKMIGDDGKEFLSAVSILTVPNPSFRQKALQACNRVRPRCAEIKKKPETEVEEKDPENDWSPTSLQSSARRGLS